MTTELTQPQSEVGPVPANGQGQSQGHRAAGAAAKTRAARRALRRRNSLRHRHQLRPRHRLRRSRNRNRRSL